MRPTKPISQVVRNLIAPSFTNRHHTPSTFDVVHPGTGTVASTVERSVAHDIKHAVDAASSGLHAWKSTSLQHRKDVLTRAGALLSDEASGWASRLVEANMAETSVTRWWSSAQIGMGTGAISGLVDSADAALAEETQEAEHATFKISREPFGVCLAMAPWNAVHILTLRAIATPLVAGNTVVLKTTEHAPRTQTLWAELLFAAGLPRDALSVVHVATPDAGDLTTQLVEDARIRHVNFTGSTRVGSIIASLAGRNLKPTLMELGGKAPLLLLPDADIETAASHIIFGAFMNAGQVCMSTERILVPESKYDELVHALRSSWRTVKDKIPRALFTPTSADRLRTLVADSVSNGAVPILDESDPDSPTVTSGAFVVPEILGGVTHSMTLYTDESFGPVAAIVRVPDSHGEHRCIEHMVSIANDTQYGLSASVWGRDVARAESVARRIESGAVHVNSPTPADPPLVPHGGWKSSGWGRFNGVEGIRSFTQTRSLEITKDPKPMPLNVFEL